MNQTVSSGFYKVSDLRTQRTQHKNQNDGNYKMDPIENTYQNRIDTS